MSTSVASGQTTSNTKVIKYLTGFNKRIIIHDSRMPCVTWTITHLHLKYKKCGNECFKNTKPHSNKTWLGPIQYITVHAETA